MGIGETLFGKAGSVDKSGMYAAQQKAREAIERAVVELQKVNLPDIRRQELELELPKLMGQLQALEAGDTELAKISTDPAMREAQLAALSQLQEKSRTGLTDADLAKYRQLGRQASSQNEAQQSAILRQMAQMGQASSGAGIAQKLLASQASANRMAEQGDTIATEASQARERAIQAAANQAAQMENTEYGRKSTVASARDAINQFNLQNKQNIANANFQNKQNMANQITNLKNEQQQYNKNLGQQDFANQLAKQGAIANAYTNQANMLNAQAPSLINKSSGKGGLAPLLTTVGGAVAGGMMTGGNPAGVSAGASLGQVGGQYASQQYQGESTYQDGGIATANNYSQDGGILGKEDIFAKENDGNTQFSEKTPLNLILRKIATKRFAEGTERAYQMPQSAQKVNFLNQQFSPVGIEEVPSLQLSKPNIAAGYEPKAQDLNLDKEGLKQEVAGWDTKNVDKDISTDNSGAWASGIGAIASQIGNDMAASRARKEADMMNSMPQTPAFNPISLGNFQPTNLNAERKPIRFEEGGLVEGEATDMSPMLKDRYSDEYLAPAYQDGNIVQKPHVAKVNDMDRAGNLADFSTVYGKGISSAEKKILGKRFACGGTAKKDYKEGGIEEGHSYVGDRVDAKINSGEMILNIDQQQRLFDLINGKTDKVEDKPVVREAKPEETNQHDKIVELDARIAELEKLLTSLAK
jgi:hypothetical protein